jgi:Holliday junction resolvase RusA-like endonuclease
MVSAAESNGAGSCLMSGAMNAPITVIVSGAPVAKGRARMTRRGFAYTPAATRKYEAHARLAAQLAMDGRPPIDVPVRVELLVELPVPASWSRRKAEAAITGGVRPTSRPDVDNYVKGILDAINTIVVVDDSQVVDLRAVKKFGVAPKLVATIFPIDAVASNRRPS